MARLALSFLPLSGLLLVACTAEPESPGRGADEGGPVIPGEDRHDGPREDPKGPDDPEAPFPEAGPALWTRAALDGDITRIISVHGTAKDDVWALAEEGNETETHHFDGKRWSRVGKLPGKGVRVFAISRSEVWALTTMSGTAWRWSGSAWTTKGQFGVTSAYALWASDAKNVWVGSQWNFGGQTPTRRWDGAQWKLVDTGSQASVTSVWGTGPNDVWASNGAILRYRDGAWETPSAPTGGKAVRAIGGAAKDALFAVGDAGLALHWNGSDWKAEPTGTDGNLALIWASGPAEAWTSSALGPLLRWDGASWTRAKETELDDSAIPRGAQTMWGTSAADLWVGWGKELFHRVPIETLAGCEELSDVGCAEDGKPSYLRCIGAATPEGACVKVREHDDPVRTGWCCPSP